ncbi:MAG: nuclear transport factor 2 family protein [Chryseolinea sp.]
MKQLASVAIFSVMSILSFGQSKNETDVRTIDALELQSFLKSDTLALNKLWSKDLVVTNPFNRVVTILQIKALIKNAKITQVKFTREIERLTLNENIAIVMAKEIPDASTASPAAPKNLLLPRRVTNIWMKKNNTWQLVARQATNIEN